MKTGVNIGNMIKSGKAACIMLLCLLCLLWAGCGKNNGENETAQDSAEMAVRFYMPIEMEEPDFAYTDMREYYDCFEGIVYIFRQYMEEGNGETVYRNFLYSYNTATGEQSNQEISFEGTEQKIAEIYGMEVVEKGHFAFFAIEFAVDEETATEYVSDCYVIETDGQGMVLAKADLLAGYYEAGQLLETPEGKQIVSGVCQTDGKGIYYLTDLLTDTLYIFDSKGNILLEEYMAGAQLGIQGSRSENGILYFVRKVEETQELEVFTYDAESGKCQPMLSFSYQPIAWDIAMCWGKAGELYYVKYTDILYYDAKAETTTEVFSLQKNGMEFDGKNGEMSVNENGELVLFDYSGEVPEIYVLTTEEVPVQEGIRIAGLETWGSNYVQGIAAGFSRKSPTYDFFVETGEEKAAYRDRIFAEMTNGEGPDLLWVSAEDMRILQEKGLLLDMADLIPEEIKEQIFPGVIEAGTIDGEFVGLSPQIGISTMITTNSVWKEDTWSVRDIATLADREETEILFLYYNEDEMRADYIFKLLVLSDLENSPFLDLEQGTSNFDSPEFIEYLELCHIFSEKPAYDLETRKDMVEEGRCLAECSLWTLDYFGYANRMLEYGADSNAVGMPTWGNSGNYLYCEGFLVVNANTENEEAIREFLACMLNEENQGKVEFNSVRRDVTLEALQNYYAGFEDYLEDMTPEAYAGMMIKPDGTTYVEDYMAFLESGVPKPYTPYEIENILIEEAGAYFAGDRNAEETAEIIQNRVQLYLDEKK